MDEEERRTPAARLLGAGARAGERVARSTGVDRALEDALEEAIVRALSSPAVERAIVRSLDSDAVQDAIGRALASDEVAEAIITALHSDVADRVWADLLASDKAQMLTERIAEAPEVRAAITQQGAGMVTDVGRRLTTITERLDDALEEGAEKLGLRTHHEQETDEAGLLTRALAAAVDAGIVLVIWSLASGALSSSLRAVADPVPTWLTITLATLGWLATGATVVAFWTLVGQTPGMRFLSIRLDHDGQRELPLRLSIRRLVGLLLAVVPAGLGVLAILRSPQRRGWHDRLAETRVVYERERSIAPHSQRPDGGLVHKG